MDESFHNNLNKSRSVLAVTGFQVIMNTTEMDVFVATTSHTTPTGNQPTRPGFQIDPLMLAILIPLSVILVVGAVVLFKRRG